MLGHMMYRRETAISSLDVHAIHHYSMLVSKKRSVILDSNHHLDSWITFNKMLHHISVRIPGRRSLFPTLSGVLHNEQTSCFRRSLQI